MNEAEKVLPKDGPRMTLTLDAKLQAAMERAFAGRGGAGVVLDPATGEILAMTSTPAYDPNEFTMGVDADLWSQLISDPAHAASQPERSRALYAPGSTFKLVMAVAGLEEGLITPETTVYCPGQVVSLRDAFPVPPGGWTRRRGLEEGPRPVACNVYFYQLGVRLEIARIATWARKLGLWARSRESTSPTRSRVSFPMREWKQRVLRVPWYAGETVSVAIGQGQVSVTPLQMARVAAVIANGGRLVRPRLVRALGGSARAAVRRRD